MSRKTKRTAAALAGVAALAGGGAAIATAAGNDDDGGERPIDGAARDRAAAVALEHVGDGRVTETEVGDEESRYEVEVTRADGGQVDVQLDADFKVVGSEADDPKDD